MLYYRDVESKDFSFDSQLLVPKIVRELDSQLPSPKNRQTPDSTSPTRKIFRLTPNSQSPKLLGSRTPKPQKSRNSRLSTPTRLPIPGLYISILVWVSNNSCSYEISHLILFGDFTGIAPNQSFTIHNVQEKNIILQNYWKQIIVKYNYIFD